ncbi:MAG: SIR2 family protein [Chloroflexi bacterium]|nr:SIR2 family protein [Chloroflexota bacterium]
MPMLARTFDELVRDLQQRRQVGDPPPVLLLGAGASVESGIGAMTDLFQFVNAANFDEFCAYIGPLTVHERFRLLARFLQSREPDQVTPGYQALATLCANNYFDFILTTNLDPLLDDALTAARLWRKDYMLLVNGVIRPDRFDLLATAREPRVKVVKLHGDLLQRLMAWTPAEMDTFLAEVSASLNIALHGRDVLVVGHSLRDARIRDLVLEAGGTIWYTHPTNVPDFLAANDRVRAVIGPNSTFEKLFPGLANSLGVLERRKGVERGVAPGALEYGLPAAPQPSAQTLDDLMASVVKVTDQTGMAGMTGFVLSEPRVIVTDGYEGNVNALGGHPTIVVHDGRTFETQVERLSKKHPFGPLILRVPDEFRVSGLRLNTAPISANLAVEVAVAAGERVGISSGVIADPREKRLQIAPVGQVSHLVEVTCVVAPGASGAPVVDKSFAVRGFIVAGATDQPPSFMYPAARWRAALGASPRP